MAFVSGITSNLTPFVPSSFAEHSLTATTSIVSSLASGLIKLPYAKLMDIWGRPQGFALMVGSLTVDLIMMAGCNSVETYCAAQVFYMVGIAFIASPYIATVWAYGPASQSALNTIGFRWGFGVWAIVIPVVSAPLFFLFYYNQRKAGEMGLVPKHESKRTTIQSIFYCVKEFDLIGIFIPALGMALFLLAFNLYTKQADEWRPQLIICFLIFGGLLIVGFICYEMHLPPSPPSHGSYSRTALSSSPTPWPQASTLPGTSGTTTFIPCSWLSTAALPGIGTEEGMNRSF
ncbi:hypothetical protein BDW75DRAFT_236396 [Aspergillus navahoensis]